MPPATSDWIDELESKEARAFAEKFKQPSLRMLDDRSTNCNGDCAHSRLGGNPLLPPNFQWPHTPKQKPMYFLCQINLAEVAPFDSAADIPPTGLLSFFYDVDEQPWGFEPKDAEHWKVEWFKEVKGLAPHSVPKGQQEIIKVSHLKFAEEMTYPDFSSGEFDEANLGDEACDEYGDWVNDAYDGNVVHRLLGHPQLVQGDLKDECQDGSGRTEGGPMDWRLLLQLDSWEKNGPMWGDCGRIYFSMTEETLKKREFDKVWLTLQCY